MRPEKMVILSKIGEKSMFFFDPGNIIKIPNDNVFHLQVAFDSNLNVKGHQKIIREKSGFESSPIGSKESKAEIIVKELSALGDEEVEIGLDFRPVPFLDSQRHTSIFIRRIAQLQDTQEKSNDFIGVIEAFGTRYGNIYDSLLQYVSPDGNPRTIIIVSNSKSVITRDIRTNYFLSLPGDRPIEHKNMGNEYISLFRGPASEIKHIWLKLMASGQHLNNFNMRYGILDQNSNWGIANLLTASGFGDLIQNKIKVESKWNSLGLYDQVLDKKYLENNGIFKFRTVDEAKKEVDKLDLKPIN
ncbi:MAG: hypothetical protein HC908_10330 [Calothrix sp. SM1_7_51]|nr:hypothetical protein [Calothrix sp. SM1_7_51]